MYRNLLNCLSDMSLVMIFNCTLDCRMRCVCLLCVSALGSRPSVAGLFVRCIQIRGFRSEPRFHASGSITDASRRRPKGGGQREAGLYKPPAPGPLGFPGNPKGIPRESQGSRGRRLIEASLPLHTPLRAAPEHALERILRAAWQAPGGGSSLPSSWGQERASVGSC